MRKKHCFDCPALEAFGAGQFHGFCSLNYKIERDEKLGFFPVDGCEKPKSIREFSERAIALSRPTPDAPDNGFCHCKYPTAARALANPNCPVCGKPPLPVI